MQDAEALERIAAELVEDKAADNVRYVEIRWGPLLHVMGGLSLADGIAAVVRGARAAAMRTGITVRLISTALRSHDPERNVELAETAARFIDHGLTGWDLAGQEAAYPDPLVHARSFEAARANGLQHHDPRRRMGRRRRRSGGRWSSTRSASPMARARSTTRRCAPSSALVGSRSTSLPPRTGRPAIVPSVAEHPIGPLYRMGVPVTLNTDDLTVSDLKLSEEYVNAAEQIGLALPDLWAIDRHALDVAFVDETTRDRLRADFDLWAANVPELAGPGG